MLSHFAAMIAALGYFIAAGFVPQGHKVYVSIGLVLVLYSILRGREIWLPVRLFVTAQVFLWSFIVCLVVRTTDAGVHTHNAGRSVSYCFLYAVIPGLCVLRLWSRKRAIILVSLLLPVGFLLSNAVAGTEEILFVRKYRDAGAGPTPRWPLPIYWLAYDKEAHRLYGPASQQR